MKKHLFYLLALICSMNLFTACSNDDATIDYSSVIENNISGNYKGTLDIALGGNTIAENVPKNITISKAGISSINLLMSNFSFAGMSLGDIELKDCQLNKNDKGYSFTGNQTLNINVLNLTADVTATGTIEDNKVTVNLAIAAKQGDTNLDVTVVYKGSKLNGNESNEAKITAFSFDLSKESNSIVLDQPVINEDNTITFTVNEKAVEENNDVLKNLVPTFTLSDKATCSIKSDIAIDLSHDVTFYVIAENGTTTEYTIKAPTQNYCDRFDFDSWENPEYGLGKNNTLLPSDIWASGAAAASLLGGVLLENEPTGTNTYAAKMTTFEYGEDANTFVPKITSGSLYIGTFDATPAFTGDRLACTSFGLQASKTISGKPITFKGLYKYISGNKYLDCSENIQGILVEGKKDQCAIQAVLYEAKDENGKEVTLTGHDINDSKYIVASAVLADGSEKAEFTSFNIPFNYKKDYKSDGDYKFTIVCSSSKDGDKFKGAGGSSLTIDNFEVICE